MELEGKCLSKTSLCAVYELGNSQSLSLGWEHTFEFLVQFKNMYVTTISNINYFMIALQIIGKISRLSSYRLHYKTPFIMISQNRFSLCHFNHDIYHIHIYTYKLLWSSHLLVLRVYSYSALISYSWQCSRNHMECQRQNLCWPHTRQATYLLYCHFSPA